MSRQKKPPGRIVCCHGTAGLRAPHKRTWAAEDTEETRSVAYWRKRVGPYDFRISLVGDDWAEYQIVEVVGQLEQAPDPPPVPRSLCPERIAILLPSGAARSGTLLKVRTKGDLPVYRLQLNPGDNGNPYAWLELAPRPVETS